MKTYAIMRMPGRAAIRNAGGRPSHADPKRVALVEAESGEAALEQFAETLGAQYTSREFRKEARYAPAFLVTRCWNGNRNHHDVKFEAWRTDKHR